MKKKNLNPVKPAIMPPPHVPTPEVKPFQRFEPMSIYLSDVVLENGELKPYKILNFQMRLNFEPVANLLEPGMPKEQVAQELANMVYNQFKTAEFWPKESAHKIKLDTDTKAQEGEFGYYQLA
jgi:hypothetical protein